MRRPPGPVACAAAVAVLGVVLRLVYGPASIGYDAAWALVWGGDLAHGRVPDFSAQGAPTPHPLENGVAALVSPLGSGALPALAALSFAAFAALGVISYVLGRRLYSPAVGVVFAAILLTRDSLVNETLQSIVDVPFLALVLGAAAAEAARPRRGLPVIALLAAAGLLRPEAWLLEAAYLAYLFPGVERGEWIRCLGVAALAPIAWSACDLIATGDALHSLHGTQRLAEDLARPRSTDVAVRALPIYLRILLHPPIAIAGVLGGLVALWAYYERSLLPAAILALGMVAFLVLGVSGLPLLTRYLLPAAAILALFCAVVVVGWTAGPDGEWRGPLIALGAVAAIVLVATAPADVRRAQRLHGFIAERRAAQNGLTAFVRRPDVRTRLRRCRVTAATARAVPDLAFALDRPPSWFQATDGALLLAPATQAVAAAYTLDPGAPSAPAGAAGKPVARSATWVLYAGRRCVSG